jgi:hypothetical protein
MSRIRDTWIHDSDGNSILVDDDGRIEVSIGDSTGADWILEDNGGMPINLKRVDPEAFKDVDVQYPLPSDGDSIYEKDVDLATSDNGGFSGSVVDYFNSLTSVNSDLTATNPKVITVGFNRSIQTHALGFGCDDPLQDFSNIVFKALGSAGEVRYTKDLSADSTKNNSFLLELPSLALNGFIVEFHTADPVGLSNLVMFKQTDVHSTLSAEQPSGEQIDIGASASGNLKVSDAENGLAIAKGEVSGSGFEHKFGNAPDFDSTDGIITIWDGSDDGHVNQMDYVYSTTDDIDSVSSSDALDTFDLYVEGQDALRNEISETVTLNGQTRVPLANTYERVYRMSNVNSVDNVGHIHCYVNTPIVGGVPTDTTKLRAVIQPGNNQTLMAVYSVPAGKTGYMRDWYAAIAGANKSSNYAMELRARQPGGVFALKHTWAISDNGTSAYQHKFEEPEVFTEKTDIEIRTTATGTGISGASVSAGFDLVLVDN